MSGHRIMVLFSTNKFNKTYLFDLLGLIFENMLTFK